jgi:hypothetical protein
MISGYNDFLTTLEAQSDKFEALKKLTLLEIAFANQRNRERTISSNSAAAAETNRGKMTKRVIFATFMLFFLMNYLCGQSRCVFLCG